MVVLTIVFVLLAIGLGVGIFFLIKLNIKKLNEDSEVLDDKTVSKAEMDRSITSYIKKVGKFGDFSLIYIDIDNFSNTNDLFGREQCDLFLREISERFTRRYPYRCVISKYNEDEFLIFIKENLTYEQVCGVCNNLLADVRKKLFVSTTESIVLTASAGICLYPSCGKTTEELIRNLELSTYISKREGGNKYTVFYKNLVKDESSNYQFFKEVKEAITNKEFCLYYQPMMDLIHNKVFGFEALMRWNHPKEGVLAPAKFISVMEQSGDIYWVGNWGLELLTQKYLEFQKNGNEDISLSLNLSSKQLTYESLADDLILVAKKAGVDASHIILEVNGYQVFERAMNVKPNLLKLRDFGFKVAVDGFELDYSTISKIAKEPIDIIKLNRSFLEDIANNEIKEKFVKMLVETCESINRMVICEGVENKEAEDYIKKNGVMYSQGYYYSKPMEEDKVLDFVRYRKWEEGSSEESTDSNKEAETNEETSENTAARNSSSVEASTNEEVDSKEDSKEKQVETNETTSDTSTDTSKDEDKSEEPKESQENNNKEE